MAKSMWIRCPECGGWCYAEKKSLIGRLWRSISKGDKELGDAAGDLVEEYFGCMKGLGKTAGRALNAVNVYEHGGEMLNGDNYKFECDNCGNEFGTDDESCDMTLEHDLFQKTEELFRKMKNLSESEKMFFQIEVEETLAKVENTRGIPDAKATLHDILACCYYYFDKDVNKAQVEINKSLNLYDDPPSHVLKGLFMGNVIGPDENYKKMNELLKINEIDYSHPYVDNALIHQELELAEKNYGGNFMSIPPNQRKFVVVTSQYTYLPESFKVIKYNDADLSGIVFESGFPNNNAIYVCHPYKPNVYYPSESYRMDLFKNQLNEFRELLQCLGAKSIVTENSISVEHRTDSSASLSGTIGGGYKGVTGNISAQLNSADSLMESMVQSMLVNDGFSFNPDAYPFIPDGLVWFDHMEEWQRLTRMRLRGQNQYSLSFSLKSTNIVNQNEANQVNADFKVLVANGNLEVSKSTELKAYESNSHEVKIVVEFYPLSDFKSGNVKVNQAKNSFSSNVKSDHNNEMTVKEGLFSNKTLWIILFVVLIGIIVALLFILFS